VPGTRFVTVTDVPSCCAANKVDEEAALLLLGVSKYSMRCHVAYESDDQVRETLVAATVPIPKPLGTGILVVKVVLDPSLSKIPSFPQYTDTV